ncbi:hypothetical protein F4777DRAFT_192560 [Nemania sp. FL0916]|nr:hypothetical protein F4777DRAFT_192560 [Nemania sp. FL0916]
METPLPRFTPFFRPNSRLPRRTASPPPESYDPKTYTAWYRKQYGNKFYGIVLDEEMLIAPDWDPDTYDPYHEVSWMPEPEEYNPETYMKWGLEYFGERWYELRYAMLQGRNIYLEHDPVYRERQRYLRVLEHQVERRPFKPGPRSGRTDDPGWKRLWTRLSAQLGDPMQLPSREPSRDNHDSDTNLGGSNSHVSTSERSESTAITDDPWEELEYNRRQFDWDDERYLFERIFLKETLIDEDRAWYEDEQGNKQAREKREAIESFRYVDKERFSLEKRYLQYHIDLPKKDWTKEEIIAKYEADVALHEWKQKNPPPKVYGPSSESVTSEEKAAIASWSRQFDDAWLHIYGAYPPNLPKNITDYSVMDLWRKGTLDRVSRQRTREALVSHTACDTFSRVKLWRRIEGMEFMERETLRKAIESARPWVDYLGYESSRRPLPPPPLEDIEYGFCVRDYIDMSVDSQHTPPHSYSGTGSPTGWEVVSLANAQGDASERKSSSKPRISTPRKKNIVRQTRRGRTSKKSLNQGKVTSREAPQCRNKTRNVCNKERASRRLLGKLPEYGMLLAPGDIEPLYEVSLQQPKTRL